MPVLIVEDCAPGLMQKPVVFPDELYGLVSNARVEALPFGIMCLDLIGQRQGIFTVLR
ncbi:hypothetical protein D9M69_670200 [compost metagenome]